MKKSTSEIVGYPASALRVSFANITGLTAIEDHPVDAEKEIKKELTNAERKTTTTQPVLPHFYQHKIRAKEHDFL